MSEVRVDEPVAGARRRLTSGTVVALALVLFAVLMTVGYLTRPDDRCTFSAVDRALYQDARFRGTVKWQWWPIGWRTECRVYGPDGRELPYHPQER